MRSPAVISGSNVYGATRFGGAIAAYYAEQLAWAHLPAPAQRFIASLDERMCRPTQHVGPRRRDDPFDDDPNLVMPADRIARIVDDRSGPASRPVAIAEIARAVDDDWVVRRWLKDVIRTSKADATDLIAIALDLWIGFGQTLHADPWFRIIGIEDLETDANVAWRSERRDLHPPHGPIGLVAGVLIEDLGGRVIATDGECVVAVPRFDVELSLRDAHTVAVRTVVGERHQKLDYLESLITIAKEGRGLDDRLTIDTSSHGWIVWFDIIIDTERSNLDSIRAELWAFLQVAHELLGSFEP